MQDRRTFRPSKAFPANEGHLGHGFLAAFGNRNLAETAFHLGSSALVLAFLRDGLARSALVMAEHVARLAELAARYADRKLDLAGFGLYLRGRREVIPPIRPPERLRQRSGQHASRHLLLNGN